MRFDFDHWKQLAKADPQAFESSRKAAIENELDWDHVSNRRELEGLQFRLDMTRRRARTPLEACQNLSRIMLEYFHAQFVPTIGPIGADSDDAQPPGGKSRGRIIPFPANPTKRRRKRCHD